MSDWRENLIEEDDDEKLAALLRATRRVAVLGIKPEDHASQAAFYVPKCLHDAGVEVIPVPVYFPDVKTILGQPVYRRVSGCGADRHGECVSPLQGCGGASGLICWRPSLKRVAAATRHSRRARSWRAPEFWSSRIAA